MPCEPGIFQPGGPPQASGTAADFVEGIQSILPVGQITSCFPKWLVQPLLQKYFCFRPTQISSLIRAVPSQKRGVAHDTNVGCGMRWTRVARLTNRADADGEV